MKAITSRGCEVVTKATHLRAEMQVLVSVNILRRALHVASFHSKVEVLKPKSSPLAHASIYQTLHYKHKYKHWILNEWKNVIFFDETKVNQLC